MRVFLLDATWRQPTEARFLLLDQNNQKYLLSVENIVRFIYVVPDESISEEWIEHVYFLLQKNSNGAMQRDLSHSIVRRRYMLSSGRLSEATDVLRVTCGGHVDFSSFRSDRIRALFGLRTPLLEHVLIENELRGWLDFDCDAACVTRVHAKVYTTTDIGACLRRSEEQPATPFIRSVSVYRHASGAYAYSTPDGRVHDDWVEAGELARALTQIDPVAVCAHGRQVLVGVNLPFPFIFIDTAAFVREHKLAFTKDLDDAVPVVEEKIDEDDIYSEDDDLEPVEKPLRFPGRVGRERCAAIFSIVARTNAIDLTLEIARITGQPWSQTLRLESRLRRVEWMIMTFFHQRNCVIPDPRKYGTPQKYTAGLVLEAQMGIHHDVLLLDFRSLYPSVVVEYNLCWSEDGAVLPQMLDYLIEHRQSLAALPGTEVARLCLKLLANTTYGALAYPAFRFYAPEIASTITAYGRQALQQTVAIASDTFSCNVIYGDTDSIFVTSDTTEDYMELAQRITTAVNANYRKLQLEFDGFYTKMLLLSKKCYVGYKSNTDTSPTIKGLLLVKKQSFGAGKRVCRFFIDQLANAQDESDYERAITATYDQATKLVEDLREIRVKRADLTIVNMLSQRLTDYGDVNIAGQYHIIAAKASRVRYDRGDYVQYIMFQGCTPIAIDQIDDLPPVPVDVKWYCARLHSMLEQIMKVLPNANASRFAKLLLRNDRNEFSDDNVLCGETAVHYTPRERVPLVVKCIICQKDIEHWGLAKIDMLLQETKCDDIIHWSSRTVLPNCPFDADIFYSCTGCGSHLDLLDAAQKLDDVRTIASVRANYNCRQSARQIQCATCRRNLMFFFKNSGVLQKFDEISETLYLTIS